MEAQNTTCQHCSVDFTIEPDDFDFYEKMDVPPPTFCYECRMQRKLVFRNEKILYKRKCDATGKDMLSIYREGTPYTVYERDYWWSDAWNPLDYGQDYNFSKPFFEQYKTLLEKVPRSNLVQTNSVNSPYSNYVLNLKNCYMVFGVDTAEDLCYCYGSIYNGCKNSMDLHQCTTVENSYWLIDSIGCNNLLYGQNCETCMDSHFLYDCKNCSNCFGCVGLRNASYNIWNKQYSKEAYKKELEKMDTGSWEKMKEYHKQFEELKLKHPHKYAHITKSENCTGDDIINAKNYTYCFAAQTDMENCKYGFRLASVKDGMDLIIVWRKSEMCYEVISGYGNNVRFSGWVWDGRDIQYSDQCFRSCSDIFGCVGLRSTNYCILNKQYSKEEYKTMIPKVIAHMNEMPYTDSKGKTYTYGEFFPAELSPFAYNESLAQEYYPLDKATAEEQGHRWKEAEKRNYEITKQPSDLPDHIRDIDDTILQEIIGCAGSDCAQCTTAFKMVPQELAFYRQKNLPLPRYCPNCRHYQRLKKRNPLKLWHKACDCEGTQSKDAIYTNTGSHTNEPNHCTTEFKTSYAPDRPEIVYCETCYTQEVA